jgi:hypothetical protein
MTCCVFERGITVVIAVEGSMTALILGEEGLIMVSPAAKTEGSILQKVSRKQKLTLEQ